MKPGKLACVLPVTTRTSKWKQELNLYGRLIQMASCLRRQQVMYPKNHLNISSQADLF